MLTLVVGSCGLEVARARWIKGSQRSLRDVWSEHMLDTMPLVLILTFTLVPSISTRIFKTFLCDRFEFSDDPQGQGTFRLYLHDDLSVRCDDSLSYQVPHI